MFKLLPYAAGVLMVSMTWVFNPGVHADTVAPPAADLCHTGSFSDAWSCYHQEQSRRPLAYKKVAVTYLPGVEKRSYSMTSQQWPQAGGATPPAWTHPVDIYVPEQAKGKRALLVINNGTHIPGEPPKQASSPPTDFDDAALADIARLTHMVVISVADVPNQYLLLPGDTQKRKEDDLVAATWQRFLNDPHRNRTLPLHVPMAEAATRAMDLAERELDVWHVHSFIVTGVSKRAWSTWLAALGDDRVAAVVPFVIGMRILPLIPYIEKSYGGAWPIALRDYYNHGILAHYQDPQFNDLMKVEDPYTYLPTRYGKRLRIPKYIVNASGDDFFPPDVSRFYIHDLPGEVSQRVVPNSDHYGIKQYLLASLIPALKRWNAGGSLPSARASWQPADDRRLKLSATSSEPPASARLWVAENPEARDFRYACGVRYRAMSATIDHNKVTAEVDAPTSGWLAMFAELTYKDGFVATTSVAIYPDKTFPSAPPADLGLACRTIGKKAGVPNQ